MAADKIAIRLMKNNRIDETPVIMCRVCGALLTTLEDMDTVASLMTLAAEHTCRGQATRTLQEIIDQQDELADKFEGMGEDDA